ncbi:hypothetical protein O3M35_012852 [Rhynocoris fuscipes]|uniref:Uncharacterized protein n=1 Tax=Rhynocoris fuscipes TaxID=488301 RepID=A0AAW1CFS2_9HEMI
MSREAYGQGLGGQPGSGSTAAGGTGVFSGNTGTRSPRSGRRLGELPTVDRSPSRNYPARGSPVGRKNRPGSPTDHGGYQMSYYQDDLASPMMDDRGRTSGPSSGAHHRSRSASRPVSNPMTVRYQSLDRTSAADHDREFVPIREPRDRSLDRVGTRERSMERSMYLEEDIYGPPFSKAITKCPSRIISRFDPSTFRIEGTCLSQLG